jgi:hypothetical protein
MITRRALLSGLAPLAFSQDRPYDESKVRPYTLPDPLRFTNGGKVKNRRDWERRRTELLGLFEQNVYGSIPTSTPDVTIDPPKVAIDALGGKAMRKMVTLRFRQGRTLDLLIYLPKNRPAPLFVGVNFRGNHTVTNDPDVPVTTKWVYTKAVGTEASRGMQASQWPIEQIIDGGYGLATFYAGDVSPDFNEGFEQGVEPLFYRPGQTHRDPGEWGALSAWAWGLSRAMDYFQIDPEINPHRVAVMGHSRMGKTALWAGARDRRFAMVISNCSGAGGATLARRRFGESVKGLWDHFPWWFCENYAKFSDNEDALPVDQHELLALSAPRPLYIAVAKEDLGSDPRGQLLSAIAATPVYKLLGTDGLAVNQMPELNQPVMSRIGFHIRPGKHDITAYDWAQYIGFAKKYM